MQLRVIPIIATIIAALAMVTALTLVFARPSSASPMQHAASAAARFQPGVAEINITKKTVPAAETVFVFSDNVSAPFVFALDDGSSKAFTAIQPGTYRFTETLPSGWALDSVDCTFEIMPLALGQRSGNAQSIATVANFAGTVTRNGNSFDVTVEDGEIANCTVTNRRAGSITLVKAAMPADGTTFDFIYGAPLDSAPPTFATKWGSNGAGDGQFSNPVGVAVDGSSNVYVADRFNHRIQKFDSSGTYLTQWGSNGAGDGQFSNPFGVAVDGSGSVYVTDRFNHRIQKFDSGGTFITKWGSLGSGDGQLNNPIGVAVDGSGNVYVADRFNHRIQKFDSSGTFITKWGTLGAGDGQFSSPTGVAVDGSGNVYVADLSNDRIQKFDSNGTFITQWGTLGAGDGQFSSPFGVAVDGSGNVYVAGQLNNRMQKFDSSGTFITKWGSLGSGDGQFSNPTGVAVDGSGNVYVADLSNDRIQKFAPADSSSTPILGVAAGSSQLVAGDLAPGTYTLSETVPSGWRLEGVSCDNGVSTTVITDGISIDLNGEETTCTFINQRLGSITLAKAATPDDGTTFDFTYGALPDSVPPTFATMWGSLGGGNGQFNLPVDVAVDGSGNVYVADQFNHRIQKFDSSGAYLAQWGSFGAGDGEFDSPVGVAVDGGGNVYVADQFNHRIQKFDSSGAYLAQWGSLGTGNREFNNPLGMALDGSGSVYVTDLNNHRIQKFDSNGAYLAQWASSGAGDGQFSMLSGAAVDGNGNVYVADAFNNRIQKFTPAAPSNTPILGVTTGGSQLVAGDLAPGTYTLSETVPSGWRLEGVSCDNGVSTTAITDGISINLNGEDTTCTFVNTSINTRVPTLTIIKTVVNDDGGTAVAGDFTIDISATNPSQTSIPGSSSGVIITLDAGNYDVTETVRVGYAASYSAGCTGTIALGESKSCTVTNDDIAPNEGSLTIVKSADVKSDQIFSFSSTTLGNFTLVDDGSNSGNSQTFVVAGDSNHTVTEALPSGWSLTNATCDNGNTPAAIFVMVGTAVTCTFTNAVQPANIAVRKTASIDVANVGESIDYSYRITNTGNVTLTNVMASDDKLGVITLGATALAPGASTTGAKSAIVQAGELPGPLVNTVVVTGTPAVGNNVTASDQAAVDLISASISLKKTVWIDGYEPACGTESDIKVPTGTTVAYCYTVTNTGDIPLVMHSLSDDKLGQIFTDKAATLAPGQSVTSVALGESATATLSVDTINTATWTAQTADLPVSAAGNRALLRPIVLQAEATAAVQISNDSDDQDNDNIPDSVEGTGDSNNNGIPNFLDSDARRLIYLPLLAR